MTGRWLWGRGVAGWGYYGLNSPSGADRDSSFWRGLLIVATAGVLAVFMPKAAACLAAAGLRRARDEPLARLAARERDVLALMAEGRSNSAIAQRLFISEKAVGKHLRQARPRPVRR